MTLERRSADVLRLIIEREAGRLLEGTLPWDWWLERAARFGQYGFGSTLLIAAQSRFATEVRSYSGWKAAGRHVLKGESGIRILSREGRPRAVFDVTQTEGPDRPPPRAPAAGAALLRELLTRQGGPVNRHDSAEVLAHRLAHHLLHDGETRRCSGVRRVEADSVSFLVLARLGLDSSGPVFPPVSAWAGSYALISAVGDRVVKTAARIHRLLDALPATGDLAALHVAAHLFFRSRLAGSWAPGYLAARGFGAGVQARWEIGYAPSTGHALTDHLRGLGHRDEALVLAGLARRGRGGALRDMFRDRLMLPIRDPAGRVAGFIGRRHEQGRGPKYLNSPETPLFQKGALLFGLYEVRDALAAGARPVVVEGPLDAIAVNTAGPRDHAAVAPCGTRLSAAQVQALAEAADVDRTGVLLALDGDAAGQEAAVRSWSALSGLSGPLAAVAFPAGQDPADLLRTGGPAAVRSALEAERPLADLVVDARLRGSDRLGFDEQRWAVAAAAAIVIARLPAHQIARQVVRVAGHLGIAPAIVTVAVASAISPVPADPEAPTTSHNDLGEAGLART